MERYTKGKKNRVTSNILAGLVEAAWEWDNWSGTRRMHASNCGMEDHDILYAP